jgi:Na+-driven multidrug efflux pump
VRRHAIELGGRVLVAAAFWQFWDALQIVFRFSLRAAGDHRWVMWVGILNSWLISVPLVFAVVHWWHGGVVHVWWVWSAEIIVGTLIFTRRWRSGTWRLKRLVRDEDRAGAATPA